MRILSRPPVVAAALLALAALLATSAFAGEPGEKKENPWEGQVQTYEKGDAKTPPPEGAILFVGSSTIRMWGSLAKDFKGLTVLGRGIGGSQIADQIHFFDRLVLRYRPAQIVFYAGDNDVWAGKNAERILADFQAFVAKVQQALPRTPVHFLTIKPSPSRVRVWPEAKKANDLVRRFAEKTDRVTFIDTATVLLDADGNADPAFFLKDRLHMNAKGYERWTPIVRAAIEKAAEPAKKP